MSKGKTGDDRVYKVRFRYRRPSRYYFLSNSSGYPSAEFRLPYATPDEQPIVVREVQE